MKKVMCMILMLMFLQITTITQASSLNIPSGAGGFNWGTDITLMPSLELIDIPNDSGINTYTVLDVYAYQYDDYLPNKMIPPYVEIKGLASTGYVAMFMSHLAIADFATIQDYLTNLYGAPSIVQTKNHTTCTWIGNHTILSLYTATDQSFDISILYN
ncbi:hypothetical protein [Propionispira raffinosivorans]|uniref:hypothetical protein n=1 Tax=Propionispira raffinosivorans TaxID=86959 RepID=UPI00035FC997|nr:hypothetical protein [Propionispira raffinosivorans]